MIGRKILHYTILERLGGDGMGEAYLAEDSRLHRRVALKFLHGDFLKDDEARERVFREARAASRLSHPNIVAVHAIEEADGHVFIATEHVTGESLRDLVQNGRVDIERAIEIAQQILAALAGAHECSVVHRDITPDNIVVTGGGRVKVLGFEPHGGAGTGTRAYMSPEQVRGENVDHRSDLFSFGAVFYEMLTGGHGTAVTHSIADESPEPLATCVPDPPDGLQAIVDKTLEKNPEKRYQSATEIEADLARVNVTG